MAGYQFERECRTPQSESYIVELDEEEVGRIDIHFELAVNQCIAVLSKLAQSVRFGRS